MDMSVMFKIGYGLYVLTGKGEKDNGCILNTVMQVTVDPNRILVAVNKVNQTHDIIMETKEFNLSILTEKASFSTFEKFGFQSGTEVDKFKDYTQMERSKNGIYYITQGTNSYISGKVVETMDVGTHTLFLADVTDGVVLNQDKSVTYDYYQTNIKPEPTKEEKEKKGYRCVICNYIYEGEELPPDYICPICKHGVADFEKIQ